MGLSLELVSPDGMAMVLSAEFGTSTARLENFWLAVTGPFGHAIGWVRFERRICTNSKALFAATELRRAGDGVPGPDPVVSFVPSLTT